MALIQVQRQDASRTIEKLIEEHHRTVRDIDGGKQFFRRGENITAALRARVIHEIDICIAVRDALAEGDFTRAVELCERVQENFNVG